MEDIPVSPDHTANDRGQALAPFGQVFGTRKLFGRVGQIFSGTRHRKILLDFNIKKDSLQILPMRVKDNLTGLVIHCLLVAVNGIFGGINIDNDFFRRCVVRFNEQFDEEFRESRKLFVSDAIFKSCNRGGGAERFFFVGIVFDCYNIEGSVRNFV